jgi:hypothetical protein
MSIAPEMRAGENKPVASTRSSKETLAIVQENRL